MASKKKAAASVAKKVVPIDGSSILPEYLGRKVRETFVSVVGAGDGLSQAMAIEPALFDPGSRHMIVLDCIVDSHKHKRIKDEDTTDMMLEQIFRAGTAVVIDADTVRDALDRQAEKLKLAAEKQAGVKRLPFVDEMVRQHELGAHENARDDSCPECNPDAVKAKRSRSAAEGTVKPIGARAKKAPAKKAAPARKAPPRTTEPAKISGIFSGTK